MAVLNHAPCIPHVSVDMLGGITSSLAKLDAKFDAKFNAVEASITELRSDVTAIRGDVGELKVDVAVLKVDVAVLKTDVAGLKVDVGGLETRTATMEADMRKLLDWKQRLWGMLLLISLAAAAPSVCTKLFGVFSAAKGASGTP